ncbi:MAG TPA: phosphate ABC transporter permease PstA [Acidimicrobiales bacterium]|jgi:phosphate transport system permease protein
MAVTTVAGVGDVSLARRGHDVKGRLFHLLVVLSVVLAFVILAALVWDMIAGGESVLTERLWSFLTSGLNSDPELAGVWQGVKGTLQLSIIVVAVAFPLGIGSAIYIEEYASDSRLTRFISVNIRNLAGVPSIVFGLLGLAIFVQALGGVTGGRTVIAGGLTLSALVLPIVIITSQEALRAVPSGIRVGALALGATRWETTRHHVLPAALPGILTGNVLALARAAGEAAPLLLVGAVSGVFFVGAQGTLEQILHGRFTAMPMVIFSWARLPAGQGWNVLAAAASLVLLVLIFVMNGFAIWLRNRYEQRW